MNTLSSYFSVKRPVHVVIAGLAALFLGGAISAQADSGISVSVTATGISATATVSGVNTMLLRIGGPNDFFEETQSQGSSVNWLLPGNAPDGWYRYEVFATGGGTSAYRETGRFDVRGGQMFELKRRQSQSSQNLWQAAAGVLSQLSEALLEILVPSAQAQDLTASSSFPTVFFEDTGSVTSPDWELIGASFAVGLFDNNGGGTIPLEIDSSPLNDLSFLSDPNGDVSLADEVLFVSRGNSVGIGTVTPQATLHVFRTTGTAKILAQETNATTAPRGMFELINNGPIGFNMTDTSVAQTWRFAAQPTGFRVSLDGSGGPEMEVGTAGTLQVGPGGTSNLSLDGSGNLTVVGTATATAHLVASDRNGA
jgi:hypothetical protein